MGKNIMRDRIHSILVEATESRDAEQRKLARSIVNKIKKNIDSINWKLCDDSWALPIKPKNGTDSSGLLYCYGIEFNLQDIMPMFPVLISFVHSYSILNSGAMFDASNNHIIVFCFHEIPATDERRGGTPYKIPETIDGSEYSVSNYRRWLKNHFKSINIEIGLIHELIHYMDNVMRNVPMISSASYTSKNAYLLSPHEFNAYYQGGIENLNKIKKRLQKATLEQNASFKDIVRWLKYDDDSFYAGFIMALERNPEYNKKFQKRLYNWYVENIEKPIRGLNK